MEDKFVICPFNKSHIINRLRIQYHLVRCKKNYPNCKKIVCPYNATEYIDPNNFINHLRQCKQNRGLDVSEEFKRKQFEMIQHGDASVQSYFTPSHVEVTDEWDKQAAASDIVYEDEITPDEEKVMRIKSDSSKAIKGAYKFMPQVSHPIGRGKLSEVYREFLNNQFKPESNHTSPFAPICISSHYDDGIFDDADASDYKNKMKDKMENTGDVYYNDSVTSFGSKYYKPSICRGRRKSVSIGRGVPITRSGVSNNDEAVDTSYSSLDIILQKLVLNEIALRKEKNNSKLSKYQENINIPLLDEMQSNSENTDTKENNIDVLEEFKRKQLEKIQHGDVNVQSNFTPSHVEVKKNDILVVEDSPLKPQEKHLSNSFSLSSEILLDKKTGSSVVKRSENKMNYLPEDLFECTSTGKEEDKHSESLQNTKNPIEYPFKSFHSIGRGKLLKK